MATGSELTYNTSASATTMANTIMGDGVTVVSASYSGDRYSSGTYSRGDSRSPEATPSDTGVILSTGYVSDFTQSSGDPNRSSQTSTNTGGVNGNDDFDDLAGTNTYDAAMLDIDFIPTGNTMTLSFTFASEEYPEYINSQYNDMVGIWVNGQPVSLSAGNGDASVTNINGSANQNLYINNTGDTYNTEMDGFTVTMSVTFPVVPGQVNSIRIGVADVSDSNYDSAVLIAADSGQTTFIAMDDAANGDLNATTVIDVLGNDINTTGNSNVRVTHINGVAVNPGDTVVLPSGDSVKLNADMTFSFTSDADGDEVNFTYQIANGSGKTDIGMVTVDTVPCFTAGTLIRVPGGERPVEALRPGDLVLTRDDGPQPLRWIGRRRVAAEGDLAPVHIAAGTFGPHRDLTVSPLHRILLRDARAQLLFGEDEVLVAARDLVDGRAVRRLPGGTVDYVHLLFDRHQIVLSEGLPSESFLPGPVMARSLEAEVLAEIVAVFPELDPATGAGYGPSARRTLRPFEARVLAAA
ncbi:Hint domain-containing protein [Frigidibacter oleivorans]|uniref:Hint domain-containing protein n=1 Tax=Frigidibacter oleivorans TaxID=2487129 RepID=UPI000F8C7AF1|nr:Hint domain-containing protein [Frigidibacter oleivorans]